MEASGAYGELEDSWPQQTEDLRASALFCDLQEIIHHAAHSALCPAFDKHLPVVILSNAHKDLRDMQEPPLALAGVKVALSPSCK